MTESTEQRILSLEKHIAQQPKSPLFAQLASYYLETGRAQEALSLCDKGLAFHPFYTTGHLIKGKTLLALNMMAEARREFELVHESLPMNDAVARLLADIPPSADEALVSPPIAGPEAAGVRTIKPKSKSPQPAEAAPIVTEPPPESIAGPEPTAEAGAAEVLSQFTEVQPETVATQAEPEAAPAPEVQESASVSLPSTEDVFGLTTPSEEPQQPAMTPEAAPEPQADVFVPEEHAAPVQQPIEEGEPFDVFAERKRVELIGMENTLSLDEYLSGNHSQAAIAEPPAPPGEQPREEIAEDPFAALRQVTLEDNPAPDAPSPPAEEPPTQNDQIEELAEKLKEAKRITPVINFSEKSTTPPSEEETPAGSGFVTPTLAEIYAKQGWFDDAIKAYRNLAANKPAEREKFEKRIEELEELKKGQQADQ